MQNRNKIFFYAIILIGVVIRLFSFSTYNFYPDSYFPLVVAHNIKNYGALVGTMGNDGMLYPDFFSWTRPIYPLLIALFTFAYPHVLGVAHAVSWISGILAIPLAYLFVTAVFRSRNAGLAGALLLAISANHAIWGGYILSDTTGILFMLVFLWLLFTRLKDHAEWGSWLDIATGVALSLAILARYEYAVILLPVLVLVIARTPGSKTKLLNLASGCFLIFSIAYAALTPWSISTAGSASQIGSIIGRLGPLDLSGIKKFALDDAPLLALFFLGIILSFKTKRYRTETLFCVSSLLLLGLVYYQINPAMQRYGAHVIPFILPVAAFALLKIIGWVRAKTKPFAYAAASAATLLLIVQLFIAVRGLHVQDNGIWFQPAYEDVASKKIANNIPKNALVIAGFPEPYFIGLSHSTYSIADSPPYVYIPESLNDREAVIIEDEGMRKIFPQFTGFIKNNLQEYKISDTLVSSPFRYGDTITETNNTVVVYSTTVKNLKRLTNQ